jgi:hypothetical protein
VKPRMFGPLLLTALVLSSAAICPAQATRFRAGGLQVYEVSASGPSHEAALKAAELHAVRSAVGEFYSSDEMLLARDLLERYLDTYYRRFVSSDRVLAERESQGTVSLRASVIVDVNALEKDLRQKRFFYKPRRRPVYYVTVAETLDGQAVSGDPVSRGAIHEGLEQILGEKRFESDAITSVGANVNLLDDPARLQEALMAAQRRGIEVLVTGKVVLTMTQQKKVHFEDYTYYRAAADVAFIRVDDGKVLARAQYDAIAGGPDSEAAKRTASVRAAGRILQDLLPKLAQEWERTMTDAVEYQVTIVGVSPTEVSVVEERLHSLLGGVEVYRRSLFEDVVVLNLYYPPERVNPGERARVEKVLKDLASPQLKLMPAAKPKQIRAVIAS